VVERSCSHGQQVRKNWAPKARKAGVKAFWQLVDVWDQNEPINLLLAGCE
jgi:hypothetical protein